MKITFLTSIDSFRFTSVQSLKVATSSSFKQILQTPAESQSKTLLVSPSSFSRALIAVKNSFASDISSTTTIQTRNCARIRQPSRSSIKWLGTFSHQSHVWRASRSTGTTRMETQKETSKELMGKQARAESSRLVREWSSTSWQWMSRKMRTAWWCRGTKTPTLWPWSAKLRTPCFPWYCRDFSLCLLLFSIFSCKKFSFCRRLKILRSDYGEKFLKKNVQIYNKKNW